MFNLIINLSKSLNYWLVVFVTKFFARLRFWLKTSKDIAEYVYIICRGTSFQDLQELLTKNRQLEITAQRSY